MRIIITLTILLLTSLLGRSQQIVKLCDDEIKGFTYITESGVPGTYNWSINSIEYDEQSSSFFVNWSNFDAGIYNISVFFESIDGCISDPVFFTVNVLECVDSHIYAPNAFTPDGDSYNNEWKPIGWNWKEIYYTIFNRWGEIIFESFNGNVGWDGTYGGKMCQDGVYIYKLEWIDISDRKNIIYGHITLIR